MPLRKGARSWNTVLASAVGGIEQVREGHPGHTRNAWAEDASTSHSNASNSIGNSPETRDSGQAVWAEGCSCNAPRYSLSHRRYRASAGRPARAREECVGGGRQYRSERRAEAMVGERENNYFTEMCSGSEPGSYLRLIDSVHHSTLGLRVIKKKYRSERRAEAGVGKREEQPDKVVEVARPNLISLISIYET